MSSVRGDRDPFYCLQVMSQATKVPKLEDYILCADIQKNQRTIFAGSLDFSKLPSIASNELRVPNLVKEGFIEVVDAREVCPYHISFGDMSIRDAKFRVRLTDRQGRVAVDLGEVEAWAGDGRNHLAIQMPDFIQMAKKLGGIAGAGTWWDAVHIECRILRIVGGEEREPDLGQDGMSGQIPCSEVHVRFEFNDWAFESESAGDTDDDIFARTLFPQHYFIRKPTSLEGWQEAVTR